MQILFKLEEVKETICISECNDLDLPQSQEQERMMRERVELENALHDIQTQLEQAKQVTACVPHCMS